MIKVPVNKVFRYYADQYLYDCTAVYLVPTAPLSRIPMHGMASDRHVMVGMVGSPRVDAHRARRGAARRRPSEFRSKDYCSAGEKSPTHPTRESADVVLEGIEFHLVLHGPIGELVGSKKFLWILHSSSSTWAAACPATLSIQFSINTYRSTR